MRAIWYRPACPDEPFSRMLDWRMLPLLGGLYAVALIDRTNLGIARIAGMELDLVSPNYL